MNKKSLSPLQRKMPTLQLSAYGEKIISILEKTPEPVYELGAIYSGLSVNEQEAFIEIVSELLKSNINPLYKKQLLMMLSFEKSRKIDDLFNDIIIDFKPNQDTNLIAPILNYCSIVKPIRAIDFCKKALKITRSIKNDFEFNFALRTLIKIDWEEAISDLKLQATQLTKNELIDQMAFVYSNISLNKWNDFLMNIEPTLKETIQKNIDQVKNRSKNHYPRTS